MCHAGTPFADKCECPEGLTGPQCELTTIGFTGDSWAMYPPLQTCRQGRISLTIVSQSPNSLIFYMGPLRANPLLMIQGTCLQRMNSLSLADRLLLNVTYKKANLQNYCLILLYDFSVGIHLLSAFVYYNVNREFKIRFV